MEEMGLFSSQGFIMTGQEGRDTSCSKENSNWMKEKVIDSENSNTLQKVAQKSDRICYWKYQSLNLTEPEITSGKDPAFNSSLDLMI